VTVPSAPLRVAGQNAPLRVAGFEGRIRLRDDGATQLFETACQALREGAFADAVDALERLLESDVEFPGAASALKCAGFWKERLEGDRATGFERGERLFALWRLFQPFAERLPDAPERALFAVKQFVFSAALLGYLSAAPEVERDGGDPDLLLQIGRCCKGIGNYERAIGCLEMANRERRDDARILSELADCYSLVNESRSAKAFLREAFFIDPQAVDLGGMESPLMKRLADRVRARGKSGPELNEWIPVYGAVWGVFNVKREMKPLELGKLKQAIYQLEKEYAGAAAQAQSTAASADPRSTVALGNPRSTVAPANPRSTVAPANPRSTVAPRLINRYIWLIDHMLATGETRERIDEVLARIRDIDPGVHSEYTT
jgi:tetratricopeptide (TPR) repeat protein